MNILWYGAVKFSAGQLLCRSENPKQAPPECGHREHFSSKLYRMFGKCQIRVRCTIMPVVGFQGELAAMTVIVQGNSVATLPSSNFV